MTFRLSEWLRKRRLRRVGFSFGIIVAGIILGFLWMRFRDRNAWPEPLPGVQLESTPPAVDADAPNAWELLAGLAPADGSPAANPSPELMSELQRYEARGLGDEEESSYPLLAAWTQEHAAAFDLWAEAAAAPYSLAQAANIESRIPVLMRVVEIARLSSYRAARFLHQDDWRSAADLWNQTLRIADHVTRGQGTLGVFVALNLTVGVCRDILVASVEHPVSEPMEAFLSEMLLEAERAILPLDVAIRDERAMAHLALAALYIPRTPETSQDVSRRHRLALRIARWLGSSPATSAAHLDAVCSHAIAAAAKPYSREGLFAGLPRWCGHGGRAPWTRDPLGALAATLFIRNTSASMAYNPNRIAELRAARIALKLARSHAARPEHQGPGNLDDLLALGLDEDAVLDPFSSDGGRFILASAAEGWAFYSVGVDQQDDGGTHDWFSSPGTQAADLLFSSEERSRRAAAWRDSPQDAQDSPNPGDR